MNLKCKAYKEILSTATKCARQFYPVVLLFSTAIGLTPSGSSTVHIYTQTVHRIQKNGTYIAIKKNWDVRAMPHLCELYLGICLTTEEKARKNLN
jgi:hypothetical protein